jgi:hypothetical protein
MRASGITCTDGPMYPAGLNRFARNLILDNENEDQRLVQGLSVVHCSAWKPNVGRLYAREKTSVTHGTRIFQSSLSMARNLVKAKTR